MPNHKSAKKRSRQAKNKNKLNRSLSSKVRTSLIKLKNDINEKKHEAATLSLQLFNSALSKAIKGRIIKKNNASRKLSSLSNKLKEIL